MYLLKCLLTVHLFDIFNFCTAALGKILAVKCAYITFVIEVCY